MLRTPWVCNVSTFITTGTVIVVYALNCLFYMPQSMVKSLCQSKDYTIVFYPLRMQHLGEMTKNQDNVSEWSDKYTCALLFQSARSMRIQLSALS